MPTDSVARALYVRAVAGDYDEALERRLVEAIAGAIGECSVAGTLPPVMCIRTGETAAALVSVLVGTLALSPAVTRSPSAIRKLTEDLRRQLVQRVRAAEQDPNTLLMRTPEGSA